MKGKLSRKMQEDSDISGNYQDIAFVYVSLCGKRLLYHLAVSEFRVKYNVIKMFC